MSRQLSFRRDDRAATDRPTASASVAAEYERGSLNANYEDRIVQHWPHKQKLE